MKSLAACVGALVVLAVVAGQAQTASPAQQRHGSAKGATVPHASDGHPDLQGIWTNATLTRLERPPELASRPTVTDEEAREFESHDIARAQDPPLGAPLIVGNLLFSGANVAYNVLFYDRGAELARIDGLKRTSLIIDPPDGKIPPLTPEARRRNAELARERARSDGVKGRPLTERCIVGNDSTAGPPMLPVLYNNYYQVVQTKDHLMIMAEMIHDVRIVRIGGTHQPANVRQWLGDSIGHWEDATLVVDTTNFTNQTRFRGSSENLHVIERFQRLNANTILYRATIDDPSSFQRPWTIEYPFVATRGPIYEYACHEGNYALRSILSGPAGEAVNKVQ